MRAARRVLVVGTGSIGLRHARLLSERRDLAVEVCDVRAEGLAEAALVVPGARQWRAYETALASAPDVVWIATPPDSHASMTSLALSAGSHVFCENPMAATLAGAREMAAAQTANGRIVDVGFVQRFMPDLVRVREEVRRGTIGPVCFMRFSIGSLATLEHARSRHQRDVFGAAALDYVYGFDTFWWILDEQPTAVFARGIEAARLPFSSNPNVVSAVVEYASQRVAEIHIDFVAQPDYGSYFFQGTHGYFEVDVIRHVVRHGDRDTRRIEEERFDYGADDILRMQRDHFFDAVEGRHPASSPAADALRSSCGVEALIRSLRSAAREPVEPV